jgi:hypothetical protein
MTCKEALKHVKIVPKGQSLQISLLIRNQESSCRENAVRFGLQRMDCLENFPIHSFRMSGGDGGGYEICIAPSIFNVNSRVHVSKVYVNGKVDGGKVDIHYHHPNGRFKKIENVSFYHIYTTMKTKTQTTKINPQDKENLLKLLPIDLKRLYYQ